MTYNQNKVRKYISEFDFKPLMIDELGWDRHDGMIEVQVDGATYSLRAIAQKRGVQIFECPAPDHGAIPDYAARKKIERQVTKSAYEHLVIYTDPEKTQQIWQWVARESGKPAAYREYPIYKGQSGDIIIQKLQSITFLLDEEEALTVTGVVFRLKDAFDKDRVTKRFYDLFKNEHGGFLKFIKGLPDENIERWYASVMINRLMFIYFIQKKGFLNSDLDYLQTKLKESKQRGKDKYYKDFLCPLFFKGFAIKEEERSQKINQLLGKIPYLNGGLFLKHQIEEHHGKKIDIPDKAFENLFMFFDRWDWHLDYRPISEGNEINPDVLGYIFEKYINQKELGAYYTKEDITGYISKNTIIPFLFDAAGKECKVAFEGDHSLWRLLQNDPDRYIYEAVRRGVILDDGSILPELKLPDFVQKGIYDPKARMFERRYNLGEAQLFDDQGKKLTLPTENWREYIERRKRCIELREKLKNGDVNDINDLITYNLNITQFAQDVIDNCEGPDLLNAFWKAIIKITVLDPTGGSGAFLFAALNILEVLYEACLQRMEAFINDWGEKGKKRHPNYYKFFSETLKRVEEHPNKKYFIYKSIIINNLFAVDILEEAVEICKLRLFLKLVAQVEPGETIEALPDIDFNIRAGNTLVGYATYDEVEKAVTSKLDFDNAMKRIEGKAEDIDRLFTLFRQQQTELGGEITVEDKEELRNRLNVLKDELNRYLAVEYGVDHKNKDEFNKWLSSHKPFHWFIDFYGIMKKGGFDVIIGNPPYVEYTKIKEQYLIKEYDTESCGNLYPYVIERGYRILNINGLFGMIVQLPIVCTDRMIPLQRKCIQQSKMLWFANFDDRPGKLFDGLQHIRATIFTSQKGVNSNNEIVYSTSYNRWYTEARSSLFQVLQYQLISEYIMPGAIPKIGNILGKSIRGKLSNLSPMGKYFLSLSGHKVYFHNSPQYWVRAMTFVPYFWNERDGEQISKQIKILSLPSKIDAEVVVAVLNSTLFYWWFLILSDCRHLNMREIETFPIGLDQISQNVKLALSNKTKLLMVDFKEHKRRKETHYQTTGKVVYDEFYPKHSKKIIDETECLLAEHYGFNDDELDFIVNYDIKYRMGRDAGERE